MARTSTPHDKSSSTLDPFPREILHSRQKRHANNCFLHKTAYSRGWNGRRGSKFSNEPYAA